MRRRVLRRRAAWRVGVLAAVPLWLLPQAGGAQASAPARAPAAALARIGAPADTLAATLDPRLALLAQVRGRVVDAATGEPLAGTLVRLVELNRAERTHDDGSFGFAGVPAGRYTLVAQRPGFQLASRPVVVEEGSDSPAPVAIPMVAAAPASLAAVVVTGSVSERARDDVLSPTSVLAAAALDRAMDGTLAATIENQPGVSVTSVGPATARPVVRGLSGDRVLVLEDGQRPGDLSGTSGDHAVAVEPLTAQQIEVVRGPMSLLYGSSALGGVVNVLRDEVPSILPEHAHGAVVLQGATVNDGLSAGGTGTTAIGRLALRGEASVRDASDLQTPLGALDNTQARTYSLGGGASYIRSSGHVGASYRFYDNQYGIPGGFVGSHPEGVDIDMRRHAFRTDGEWRPSSGGAVQSLRASAQLTDYEHEELTKSGSVGTAFAQRLSAGEVVARTGGLGPLTAGAVGMRAQFRDVSVGGALRAPDTRDYSLAGFAVQEYVAGRFRLQGGLRYDWARYEPQETRFVNVGGEATPTLPRTFGSLSGSLGALVELRDGVRVGASLSRAYRTPDFNELYSDGPHLAAYSYDVGNPELEEETGIGADLFVRVSRPRWRAEVAAFRNDMSNYVFPRNTGELGRQGGRPKFQYVGRDALLTGVEGDATVNLADRWVLEGTASYVRGTVESRGDSVPVNNDLSNLAPASRYLPLMPPANGRLMLRYEAPRWFAGVGGRAAARQTRLGDFETETAGYGLLDLQAGLRLPVGGNVHTLTLRVDNALDQTYREHLSRTKLVMPEAGRNVSLLYRVAF